ncbi:hypothetical protein VTK56DRAFT_1271 [Thermocarpiscus australiensis]
MQLPTCLARRHLRGPVLVSVACHLSIHEALAVFPITPYGVLLTDGVLLVFPSTCPAVLFLPFFAICEGWSHALLIGQHERALCLVSHLRWHIRDFSRDFRQALMWPRIRRSGSIASVFTGCSSMLALSYLPNGPFDTEEQRE